MQTVLVTGGAGYVGAHCCLALAEAGFRPVVFDDLSNGHREHVQWGPLEVGDIRNAARLDAVFAAHAPVAVLHFAARIEVGESVTNPGVFFDVNVGGAITLIEAARRAGVNALVFSSTCATFGDPVHLPMTETHPQAPLNPYGRSKLMVEQALADYDRYVGFRSTVMRYFNAAGADPQGRIGEWHEPETHAVPLAIQVALGQRSRFTIFGDDYDTRDGTAVRDYVHVLDLADAHVAALRRLLAGGASDAFNLGTGTGTTVRELVDGVGRAIGRSLPFEVAPRRPGDAPVLIGDNAKARDQLGWRPSRDLDAILDSAWRWHRSRTKL
ncbi:UDP-glucose 4-epimerase [Caulobacter sp. BE264]|uniref:UDP-glucose 4-epimerase GalE n=1 Tax=Caulobacter sp. BE264 TaxID=2817724 RepID=UPI002855715D|nr:UDP-glucose 4-epimerase GalE [Caulobacter sp. BE264]MDR7230891.1 UDP-glucose 4-epimerase [Caulobacter sp. BE264]